MAEQIQYMGSQPRLMTAEELLRNDIPHKSTELVRGVLVVREPPGAQSGTLDGEDVLPGFTCQLSDILR